MVIAKKNLNRIIMLVLVLIMALGTFAIIVRRYRTQRNRTRK